MAEGLRPNEVVILQLVQQTFDLQPAGSDFRNATLLALHSKLTTPSSHGARVKELISDAMDSYLMNVAASVADRHAPLDLLTEYTQYVVILCLSFFVLTLSFLVFFFSCFSLLFFFLLDNGIVLNL